MKRRKRQANGTGTKIKTLPSGLLRKDISLGTKNDGKRDRRAVYGKTPEEIAKKVLELQYRHGFNLDSETSALTFGAMLDLWLYSRREYLEESSLERYEQYLKSYVPKRLKDMPLQDIRASHLTALDVDLVKRGLSFTTRSKTFQHIRATFREAVVRDFIRVNPATSIRVRATQADMERRSDPVQKALTDSEMDTFLIAAEGHELETLFYTMFALGLRVGEALGLKWSDIDFKAHEVRIVQQAKLVRYKVVMGNLKTSSSKRKLPLSSDLIAMLERHKWEQDKLKFILGKSWTDNDLVFASNVGTPRDRNNVNKAIRKIRVKAGIRAFSSHACRHTNITGLFREGVSAEVIAKHAGHKNSTITTSIYRSVFEDEMPVVNLENRRMASRAKAENDRTSNVLPSAEGLGG